MTNSRVIGKTLESLLDDTIHQTYRIDGRIWAIWHEGTRCIPTRSGWKPVDSRPDYAGVLPGGRFVCFDAKHCQEKRYRHSDKRLHQLRDLWAVHEAGGLAGILVVNLGTEMAWWLLPQPEWGDMQFTSVALEPDGNIVAVRVPRATGYWDFVPDWLEAAL